MRITISSIVIGLKKKKLLFSTNSFAKLLSDSFLLDSLFLSVIGQCVIEQLNKPIFRSKLQFKSTNHKPCFQSSAIYVSFVSL